MEVFHFDYFRRSFGVFSRQTSHRVDHFADEDSVPLLEVRPTGIEC